MGAFLFLQVAFKPSTGFLVRRIGDVSPFPGLSLHNELRRLILQIRFSMKLQLPIGMDVIEIAIGIEIGS